MPRDLRAQGFLTGNGETAIKNPLERLCSVGLRAY